MRYPWSGSASRKFRNGHWMALRWDGNQRQAKMLAARFRCIFWDNGWFTYRKLKNQTIPLSTPYAT